MAGSSSKLTSRIEIPPSRPSKAWSMPERCSPSSVRFAAPNCGAPLTAPLRSGQTLIATGGSGGITRPPAPKNNGRRSSRWSERRPKQTPSNLEGLDRVAPYQKRDQFHGGGSGRRRIYTISRSRPVSRGIDERCATTRGVFQMLMSAANEEPPGFCGFADKITVMRVPMPLPAAQRS